MNITVWSNFSKRVNSTKQPGGGQSIDVKLKDNCSIENPIFLLATGGGMPDYTYAVAFGHYYFVTDVISVNASMAEIHCVSDPMANLKGVIGASEFFVVYDESPNSEIVDTRLQTKTTPMTATSGGVALDHFSQIGTIILTCTDKDATHAYAVRPADVAMIVPDFDQQIQDLFDTDVSSYTSWESNGVGVLLTFLKQSLQSGRIPDNIQDIRWIPFTITDYSDAVKIKLGKYETSVYGSPIGLGATRILTGSASQQIPWRFYDWRNTDPYTQIYVQLPFVGVINIPASSLIGCTSLRLAYSIDKLSGSIAYELYANTLGDLIGTYGADTSVKVAIGNSASNVFQITNGLIQAGNSIINANPSGFLGGISSFAPIPQTVGGVSSAAAVGTSCKFKIISIAHDTTVTPDSVKSVIGTPAFQKKMIGSLSGYIQCQNASINANCRQSERDVVNGYLNSGFFYE